jgi:hypothetical protein
LLIMSAADSSSSTGDPRSPSSCTSDSAARMRKASTAINSNAVDEGVDAAKVPRTASTDSDFEAMLRANTDEEDEEDKPMRVLTKMGKNKNGKKKIPHYRKGDIVWFLEVTGLIRGYIVDRRLICLTCLYLGRLL